jgi:hypothetical protein
MAMEAGMIGWFQARAWGVAKRGILVLVVALSLGAAACSAPSVGGDPTAAARTAIAEGQKQAYHTRLPGDGCDINGGLWSSGRNTSVACGPNATHVSEGKGEFVGELFFDWKDGNAFPANYSVAVSIAGLPSDGCAGITTRQQKNSLGAYGLYICGDGEQNIVRYNATSGKPTTIGGADQPHASAGSSFQITASSIGDQQCMQVTGQQKFCATDAVFKTTESIGLAVFADSGSGSADFSDFTFTPLP